MEEKTKDVHDDYIYSYDFKEELDCVEQMEDILSGSFKNHGAMYFNSLDYDSEFKDNEEIYEALHESDIDHASFSCADIFKETRDEYFFFFWSIFS